MHSTTVSLSILYIMFGCSKLLHDRRHTMRRGINFWHSRNLLLTLGSPRPRADFGCWHSLARLIRGPHCRVSQRRQKSHFAGFFWYIKYSYLLRSNIATSVCDPLCTRLGTLSIDYLGFVVTKDSSFWGAVFTILKDGQEKDLRSNQSSPSSSRRWASGHQCNW